MLLDVDYSPCDLLEFIRDFLDGNGLEVTNSEELLQTIIENFDQVNSEFDPEAFLSEIDDE
jgi:hypothetical protein